MDHERFLEAVREDDTESVKYYLQQDNADIEYRGYLNQTALIIAARNGDIRIVRLLVENGADVNNAWYKDRKTGTPLKFAAEHGHFDIVQYLMEKGSHINNPISGRCGPLIDASHNGHFKIVNELVRAGANVHSTTADGTAPLTFIAGFGPKHAIKPNQVEIIGCLQTLIDAGADVNSTDKLGKNPLTAAIIAMNADTVRFLLDNGSDPNQAADLLTPNQIVRSPSCLEALIAAGINQSPFNRLITPALLDRADASAELLASHLPESIKETHLKGIQLVKAASIDDPEKFHDAIKPFIGSEIMGLYGTILMARVLWHVRGQREKIDMLLNAGVDINRDLGSHTPLILATRKNDFKLIEALINAGADPNIGYHGTASPLMIAYGADRLFDERSLPAKRFSEYVDNLAKLLIEAGADIDAQGTYGWTALMCALNRYPFNLKRLLDAGANADIQNTYGWTALMLADTRNARLLLDTGADVSIRNDKGRSAIFFCSGPTKANLLKRAGANPLERDNDGVTLLMHYAAGCNITMVKWASRYKRNIGVVDKHGRNALFHATYQFRCDDRLALMEYLISIGENPNCVTKTGDTLLTHVSRYHDLDLTNFSLKYGSDVNATNNEGYSALMIASQFYDNGSTVKFLLAHGADPAIRGRDGKTAIEIAEQHAKPQTVKLIRYALEWNRGNT